METTRLSEMLLTTFKTSASASAALFPVSSSHYDKEKEFIIISILCSLLPVIPRSSVLSETIQLKFKFIFGIHGTPRTNIRITKFIKNNSLQ
jgi:hypothetical protein